MLLAPSLDPDAGDLPLDALVESALAARNPLLGGDKPPTTP